jgi:hypothetical protein
LRRSAATAPALLLALALAGCSTIVRPPEPHTVTGRAPAGAEEVAGRLAAALRDRGFAVQRQDAAGLRATSRSGAAPYATCRTIVVHDTDTEIGRRDWSRARDAGGTVDVVLIPTGSDGTAGGAGTTVGITTTFSGLYHNRFRNLPFDSLCSSNGRLEQELLAAATAAAG